MWRACAWLCRGAYRTVRVSLRGDCSVRTPPRGGCIGRGVASAKIHPSRRRRERRASTRVTVKTTTGTRTIPVPYRVGPFMYHLGLNLLRLVLYIDINFVHVTMPLDGLHAETPSRHWGGRELYQPPWVPSRCYLRHSYLSNSYETPGSVGEHVILVCA